ncbi:MAG: DUF99 family protein [Methanomassiliicoccales archaeon]
MKNQIRVLGIDDSPFTFGTSRVTVIGVVMRLPSYIEGVTKSECDIDGSDANDSVIRMIINSRFKEQIKIILIDGIALGGFNVIDPSIIHKATGIPCATITRKKPDLDMMKKALVKHFPDWERRFEVITRFFPNPVSIDHKRIFVAVDGMEFEEATSIIRSCILRGNIPEPIRVAHLIASAIVHGESRGPA